MEKDKKTITLNADKIKAISDQLLFPDKDVEIKSATIKDALCNYSYELLTGKTAGDVCTRKGNHIIHEDLENAFANLNVFLAHLDDAYTGNDNSTTIEELREETETDKYFVTGLKVTGVEENKALILSGRKTVENGIITFTAPKVKLDGNYLYLTQIQEALFKVLNQVEAYMLGKTAPQPEQTSMEFDDDEEMDDDFEQAKVSV